MVLVIALGRQFSPSPRVWHDELLFTFAAERGSTGVLGLRAYQKVNDQPIRTHVMGDVRFSPQIAPSRRGSARRPQQETRNI